ncbi:MAG: protein translocase subunit SecD [Chloroflexi bacterium]|nr:protein translocase subunit SecD [Chloroflexota bacterium]
MRTTTARLLIAIVLIAVAAIWVSLPNNPGVHLNVLGLRINQEIDVHQGLDLQGGVQVLLQADAPPDVSIPPDSMQVAKQIIEQRVNALGVAEPMVQLASQNRIIVELPGIRDPDQAIRTFGETGLLEIVDTGSQALPIGAVVHTSLGGPRQETTGEVSPAGAAPLTPAPSQGERELAPTPPAAAPATGAPGTAAATAAGSTPSQPAPLTPALSQRERELAPTAPSPVPSPAPTVYKTVLQGRHVSGADVTFDQLNRAQISFRLTGEGAGIFADHTTKNVGRFLSITLDKQVISSASIREPITQGEGVISSPNGFPLREAQSIVIQLKYGSLPVPLKVVQNRTIGPTLGQDSVQKSIVAGAIGLGIVAAFMLVYYRLPGLLADTALLIYAATVFALFKLIPVTLTLAGIAGFILSIGMAVDANILIFERMREELRAGRTLRAAIDAGFDRAWTSIRDSNSSTLITCAILFWFGANFGASIIQGFALTLAIGVIISMFTAVYVSRTFLRAVVTMGWVRDLRWIGFLDQPVVTAPAAPAAPERE